MIMPKFEPVGWLGTATHPDDIDGEESVVYCFSQEMATTYRDESGYEIEPHFSEDQLTEAYEAGKREASEDLEQAAFEKWLYDKCPSGDVESVQRQWLESYEYAELAGKRDATPEGYALVPKQPTLLMLRAMYPCESTTEAYKAMLAAAPERRRMMTLVELLQQAASESDTPNTSIEGKAANLIERQAAQIEMMRSTLHGIVDADWRKWEELASPEEFVRWAKSRANHVLSTTTEQALEQFAAKVREQCAQMLLNG